MRGKGGRPKVEPRRYGPGERVGVMFACPSEDGRVGWSIAQAMANMMWNNADDRCPFVFEPHVVPGIRPIQYARNVIRDRFLSTKHEWLVMVDDDQVMPENWWHLLGVNGADVVSGTTYVWMGNDYKEGRI